MKAKAATRQAPIKPTKPARLYDGDTFTHGGYSFRVTFPPDEDHGPPWENSDGHGPVSDWRRSDKIGADKAPGERVLCSDGRHSYRLYDFAEAVRIAKRDGWDAPPYGTGTKNERATRAAEADFEYLARWCNDAWHYCGVVVNLCDDGNSTDDGAIVQESIWGIEDECLDYLTSTAYELADEIIRRIEVDQPDAIVSEN